MTSLSRKMLLATDGSEGAELAAGVAVEFARSTGSELHVVHVKLLPITPPYPDVLDWTLMLIHTKVSGDGEPRAPGHGNR